MFDADFGHTLPRPLVSFADYRGSGILGSMKLDLAGVCLISHGGGSGGGDVFGAGAA